MLRVFIYPRVGTACDNKWLLSKAVNLHLWEVAALELLKRALPVTTDAAQADVFLVDECLQLEYFSTRPLTHSGFFGCPRCHSLDARVVTAMRRIGVQWDTVPRRHIVTHLECPRVGHADTLDPAFPELWGKRRSLILCVQNSRPGRPDVLRTVHLPYYAHSHAGIQPIVPAINRTVDFLFAGTFSAWYPRAWLRDTMLPAASSRLLLFESREASAAELARLNELGRFARFVVSPPGDVPETVRPYQALAMGTPPLLIEDSTNLLRPTWILRACELVGMCDVACAGKLRLAGASTADWAGMSVRVGIDDLFSTAGGTHRRSSSTGSTLGALGLTRRRVRPRRLIDMPVVQRLLQVPGAYARLLDRLETNREAALWGTRAFEAQFVSALRRALSRGDEASWRCRTSC